VYPLLSHEFIGFLVEFQPQIAAVVSISPKNFRIVRPNIPHRDFVQKVVFELQFFHLTVPQSLVFTFIEVTFDLLPRPNMLTSQRYLDSKVG